MINDSRLWSVIWLKFRRARLRYAYVSSGLAQHRIEDALELLRDAGYDGVALTLDHVHFDPLAPRVRVRAERLGALLDELGLARVVETDSRYLLDRRRADYPSLLDEGRQRRSSCCGGRSTSQRRCGRPSCHCGRARRRPGSTPSARGRRCWTGWSASWPGRR